MFERSLDEFTDDYMEGPRLQPSLEDLEGWG
jgi:hypothetical protein